MSNEQLAELETLTFEQAFSELEKTVQQLEGGKLPLAESLALYERGMALAKHCGLKLDQAEFSIQHLTPSGTLAEFEE